MYLVITIITITTTISFRRIPFRYASYNEVIILIIIIILICVICIIIIITIFASNLATTYFSQEKFAKVDSLYLPHIDGIKAVYGTEHPSVIDMMKKLMTSMEKQGKYVEAIQIMLKFKS